MGFDWWKRAWRDFQESADPDDLVAASTPASIFGGAGALVAAILVLAFVPPLSTITELSRPWLSSLLVSVGAILTYLAWLRGCRGTLGTWATLFDNTFYSSGLAIAAMSCTEGMGIALAVIHGLMVVSFPARNYAITWLFSIVMVVPVLGALAWIQPSLPVGLVLVASLVLMLVYSQSTRVRREEQLRQEQLEQALGAANQLADESVQAALTTTLLTLGHFLHELRNYQTAIAANLEYVEAAGNLGSTAREALAEAQEAQQGQADLMRRTIEELRERSSGGSGSFLLRETLLETSAEVQDVALTVDSEVEYEIRGNPEHFRVVMLNLTRNAAQAGARNVHCALRGEASGTAVQLTIGDDGTGIVEEKRGQLFDSFALSEKPGGSGLGLYLIRRYIEILGGTIREGVESPLGGAAFIISLPARSLAERNRLSIDLTP